MSKKVKDEKIQTGLRIPQKRYEELVILAGEIGVSLNSLVLTLIDVGVKAVNHGIQVESHSLTHNHQGIS